MEVLTDDVRTIAIEATNMVPTRHSSGITSKTILVTARYSTKIILKMGEIPQDILGILFVHLFIHSFIPSFSLYATHLKQVWAANNSNI